MKSFKSMLAALAFVSALGAAFVSSATSSNSGPIIAEFHHPSVNIFCAEDMTDQSNCDIIFNPLYTRCSVGSGAWPAFKKGTNCQTTLWTPTP